MKAYDFRWSLQQQWHDTENGFRISGGSIGPDRLAIESEIRLKHSLSNDVDVRVQLKEETFYDKKPLPHPLLEIALHPWLIPIELSVLGTAAYDKRQADLGAAISFGLRPQNYFRVIWLEQDYFYNSKNVFDESRYTQRPRVFQIHSDYWFNTQLHGQFSWQQSRPLTLLLTEEKQKFQQKSKQLHLGLSYHYQQNNIFAIAYHNFEIDKSLEENEHQQQTITFNSLDIHWTRFFYFSYEVTVGSQLDIFSNQLRNITFPDQHFDDSFSTWQLYSTLYHSYSSHAAWDIGLYMGRVKKEKNYLQKDISDTQKNATETKLRTSWEYHSVNHNSSLIFHFSFNLDDLANDPGDGGGISFQMKI